MASTESVWHGSLVVASCGNDEFTARDAIESALFRGEIEQLWGQFLFRVAAGERAGELELELDDDAFDAAAEQFRYQYDLITAEETEQWLNMRGLSLDDFSDYFARQQWGGAELEDVRPQEIDYASAPPELRDLFTIDMILSGRLDQMTTMLSWRLAARAAEKDLPPELVAAEKQSFIERTGKQEAEIRSWLEKLGRDQAWFDEECAREAAFHRRCETLLVPSARQRELGTLRLPLMKFEVEVLQLESRDAAQEALFCVREDGMSMEEVATEGRYPFRQVEFVLEDLSGDVQQRFLGVVDGDVLDPLDRGDGFELCRVVRKIEPTADDPATQKRIEQRLLNRHFSELASKHVDLRLVPISA